MHKGQNVPLPVLAIPSVRLAVEIHGFHKPTVIAQHGFLKGSAVGNFSLHLDNFHLVYLLLDIVTMGIDILTHFISTARVGHWLVDKPLSNWNGTKNSQDFVISRANLLVFVWLIGL